MKKPLTILILALLVLSMVEAALPRNFNPFPQIPLAHASSVEKVSNGGFESGVMTPWQRNNTIGVGVTSYSAHTGTYKLQFNDNTASSSKSMAWQDFTPNFYIYAKITSFGFWYQTTSTFHIVCNVTIGFSGVDSNVTTGNLASAGSWAYYNLLPLLHQGEIVWTIYFYQSDFGSMSYDYIDDVSLQYDSSIYSYGNDNYFYNVSSGGQYPHPIFLQTYVRVDNFSMAYGSPCPIITDIDYAGSKSFAVWLWKNSTGYYLWCMICSAFQPSITYRAAANVSITLTSWYNITYTYQQISSTEYGKCWVNDVLVFSLTTTTESYWYERMNFGYHDSEYAPDYPDYISLYYDDIIYTDGVAGDAINDNFESLLWSGNTYARGSPNWFCAGDAETQASISHSATHSVHIPEIPPSTFNFNFYVDPAAVGTVTFKLNDTSESCSNSSAYTAALNIGDTANCTAPQQVTVGGTVYGFLDWEISNSSGNFVVSTQTAYLPVSADNTLSMLFSDITPQTLNIYADPSDVGTVTFLLNSTSHSCSNSTPYTTTWTINTCANLTVLPLIETVSSVSFGFQNWEVVNGTGEFDNVTGLSVMINVTGTTSVSLLFADITRYDYHMNVENTISKFFDGGTATGGLGTKTNFLLNQNYNVTYTFNVRLNSYSGDTDVLYCTWIQEQSWYYGVQFCLGNRSDGSCYFQVFNMADGSNYNVTVTLGHWYNMTYTIWMDSGHTTVYNSFYVDTAALWSWSGSSHLTYKMNAFDLGCFGTYGATTNIDLLYDDISVKAWNSGGIVYNFLENFETYPYVPNYNWDSEHGYPLVNMTSEALSGSYCLEIPPSPIYTLTFSAHPESYVNYDFTGFDAWNSYRTATYTTPSTVQIEAGDIEITADNSSEINGIKNYTFTYWFSNATDIYSDATVDLTINGDSTLQMIYENTSSTPPPFQFEYPHDAQSITWYMRSDTWTVWTQLGYKLQTDDTATPTADSRFETSTESTTYGFRVFYIDYLNNTAELTGGSPEALVTKNTADATMMTVYWDCPACSSLISAIEIRVYQRFGTGAWSLRTIFISKPDLLWNLPAATWQFHIYVQRQVGSTNSTFYYGSYNIYSSRVDLQYYVADPWESALARLYQLDFFGFLFMPWTYYLPDIFYGLVMMFIVVTSILYHGTVKMILAEFWIFGGAGSILWAMIPPLALHIAVLFLAIAMGWTFMRLIYGRRY